MHRHPDHERADGWWVSTKDPHMGIDVRMAQIGHLSIDYPQVNPQVSSTHGDKLGIVVRDEALVAFVTGVKGVARASHGPRLGLDPAGQIGDLVEQRPTFGHQLADLAVGVHDGRVVPATEGLPDLRQRQIGELPT